MTRDEKIQKINDELEKLTDDELDEVIAVTKRQISDDSKILYELKIIDDWYSQAEIIFDWNGNKTQKIVTGWAKVGIDCKTMKDNTKSNEYYYNGKKISQSAACKIARELVKNHRG